EVPVRGGVPVDEDARAALLPRALPGGGGGVGEGALGAAAGGGDGAPEAGLGLPREPLRERAAPVAVVVVAHAVPRAEGGPGVRAGGAGLGELAVGAGGLLAGSLPGGL